MNESLEYYWKFLLSRLGGVLCLILSLGLLVALATYNSGDPSFNTVTGSKPRNILGFTGSCAADIFLQVMGITAFFIIPVLASWGVMILSGRPISRMWLRFASLLAAIIAGSWLFSLFGQPKAWPMASGLGGFMGDLLGSALPDSLNILIGIILLGFFVAVYGYSFGMSMAQWKYIALNAYYLAEHWLCLARNFLVSLMSRTVEYEEVEEAPPPVVRRRRKAAAEDDSVIIRKAAPEEVEETQEHTSRKRRQASNKSQQSLKFHETREFELPPSNLFTAPPKRKKETISESALAQNAKMLESVLVDFGVQGKINKIRPGPVVTLYELEPAPGIKTSRVIGLADDIARSMSALSARISVIPGKNAIGIELPNATRETVYFRELLESPQFKKNEAKLPVALGKDIGGEQVTVDLAKMPHLLMAGTTGSGKSVSVNAMILSLLYRLTPDECKFIMIDPKMLELSVYDGIPHLLAPVVTEPGKAVVALKWTVKEMENRYRLMSNLGVRNIGGYNDKIREAIQNGEVLTRNVQTGYDPDSGKPVVEEMPIDMNPLPLIVVVVDEMADLMIVAGKDIEGSIQRLAQMARAAGIHIVMATQRPSVDVITGVIKANFPTRISFQVTSKIDSRTILGEQGAEQLLGMGDMLYMAGGGKISRVHGPFVKDDEVEAVVKFLKEQGEPSYIEDITRDDEEEAAAEGGDGEGGDLYREAVNIVTLEKKASTSYIQRRLKIGYNRAADLIDRMEQEGIISPPNHAGKREVLR